MKPALGASARSAFLPRLRWGAECVPLADGGETWRLAGIPDDRVPFDPETAPKAERFTGDRAAAEAYARARGLDRQGLGLAFHRPFARMLPLPGATESGGLEPESLAERALPAGLKPEQAEWRVFRTGDAPFAAVVRQDALHGLIDGLPPGLASLATLAPGVTALLPHAATSSMPSSCAALYALAEETHACFFREGRLDRIQSVPAGYANGAGEFSRELRKALVYWWEGHAGGAPVQGAQIWADGPGGETAKALAAMGIPVAAAQWSKDLATVPPEWRLATAAALVQADSTHGSCPDFGPVGMAGADRHRAWMAASGRLAWAGGMGIAALAACIVFLAGGVRLGESLIDSKSREWAGPLAKWETLKGLRTRVDGRLQESGTLIAKGNRPSDQIAAVAALLPDGVWLDRWETSAPPDSGYRHLLAGYAMAEARVPECVAALQRSGKFRNVRLRLTERLPGAKVAEATGLAANRIDLVRFELVAER